MAYLATSINESPVISEQAGADITDVRGKAVKFDTNGTVILAGAGEVILGVGIMTNNETTAAGDDVDIQIKDIGLVLAGDTFSKGAELTTDADGAFVAAASGVVSAIALEAASAKGVYTKARLVTYTKA